MELLGDFSAPPPTERLNFCRIMYFPVQVPQILEVCMDPDPDPDPRIFQDPDPDPSLPGSVRSVADPKRAKNPLKMYEILVKS